MPADGFGKWIASKYINIDMHNILFTSLLMWKKQPFPHFERVGPLGAHQGTLLWPPGLGTHLIVWVHSGVHLKGAYIPSFLNFIIFFLLLVQGYFHHLEFFKKARLLLAKGVRFPLDTQ